MTPDQVVYLICNVGLGAGLCVFFVIQGAKREAKLAARVTALEDGLHQHLLELLQSTTKEISESSENRRQLTESINQQTRAIEQSGSATERLVSILQGRPCVAGDRTK